MKFHSSSIHGLILIEVQYKSFVNTLLERVPIPIIFLSAKLSDRLFIVTVSVNNIYHQHNHVFARMSTKNVLVSYNDNIQIITLNRPTKKNAIDLDMYVELTEILKTAAVDDQVLITVITGAGDYFSSGNDLMAAINRRVGDIVNDAKIIIKNFVSAFIEFPKILIGIVNGPAIGIAATTLALYDLVFASENAFFYTPFTKLGLVAEGCSTYTFPIMMGKHKAIEMLLFNYKMPSSEALQYGFVNYTFKPEEIQTKVWDKIYEVAKLPKNSVLSTKRLMTSYNKEELVQANIRETEELANVWASEEFFNNLLAFSERKKNSKL